MTTESRRPAARRYRERMSPEQRHLQGFVGAANQSAKRYGSTERLSVRDVRLVSGPCGHCGGPSGEWDHVIPLRSGGRNHVSNLVPSCAPCNRRRPRPIGMKPMPEVVAGIWASMTDEERHRRVHRMQDARYPTWVCKQCKAVA